LALAYAIDGSRSQVDSSDVVIVGEVQTQPIENNNANISLPKRVPNPNGISKGDIVEFVDTKTGELLCYTIVNQNETNIKYNKLAIDTPIGSHLAGHIAGEDVIIKTPGGERHFRICNVTK